MSKNWIAAFTDGKTRQVRAEDIKDVINQLTNDGLGYDPATIIAIVREDWKNVEGN